MATTPKIQRCTICDAPTGRCEEDSIYIPCPDDNPGGHDIGPVCEECYFEPAPTVPCEVCNGPIGPMTGAVMVAVMDRYGRRRATGPFHQACAPKG